MSAAPRYQVRGIDVLGYPTEADLLSELFDGGTVKTGVMVAVNAEKIVACERDPALRRVAQQAAYPYADGIGVVRSIRKKYTVDVDRIAGVDLWQSMMRRAAREQTGVFLLGGRPAVLDTVRRRVEDEWGVRVVGSRHGYFDDTERAGVLDAVRESGAAIVTVALGSPKQELFMAECARMHPEALYIGVGGTFDVVSGQVRRAPESWRRLGLEWLYRVLSQPTRLGRVGRLVRFAVYYRLNRL